MNPKRILRGNKLYMHEKILPTPNPTHPLPQPSKSRVIPITARRQIEVTTVTDTWFIIALACLSPQCRASEQRGEPLPQQTSIEVPAPGEKMATQYNIQFEKQRLAHWQSWAPNPGIHVQSLIRDPAILFMTFGALAGKRSTKKPPVTRQVSLLNMSKEKAIFPYNATAGESDWTGEDHMAGIHN